MRYQIKEVNYTSKRDIKYYHKINTLKKLMKEVHNIERKYLTDGFLDDINKKLKLSFQETKVKINDKPNEFSLIYNNPKLVKVKREQVFEEGSDKVFIKNNFEKVIPKVNFIIENVTNGNLSGFSLALKQARDNVRKQISVIREEMKTLSVQERDIKIPNINRTTKYKVIGNEFENAIHFMEPGTILKLQKFKNLELLFKDKKPLDNTHHVGVEIECYLTCSQEDLALELCEKDLGKYVRIKNDGSLNSPMKHARTACELNIIAPQTQICEVIDQVCTILNSKKVAAQVNKTCGLHVHLDMRQTNRNKEVIFHNLVCTQGVFFTMNPKTRRKSHYSKFVEDSNFANQLEDHHNAINGLAAFNRHKTIEVRIHTGTVNAIKINNWIQLLMSIASKETKVVKAIDELDILNSEFNLDANLLKYIASRIQHFKTAEEESE